MESKLIAFVMWIVVTVIGAALVVTSLRSSDCGVVPDGAKIIGYLGGALLAGATSVMLLVGMRHLFHGHRS